MRSSLLICSLGLTAALLACQTKDEGPAPKPSPAELAPEPVAHQDPVAPAAASEVPATGAGKSPLQAAMDQHFLRAVQLERAVIDGDLEQAVAHAKWIVEEQPKQDMAEAWTPLLAAMTGAAGEIAAAEDLPSAARATGQLVASCGACHRALDSGPRFAAPPPVTEGETSSARMERHRWAASRMREGIVGPSEDHWKAGAGAVSVAPPQPCPIPDGEILPAEVLDLRERIYQIGAEAAATTDHDSRARVYGEFLTTCAGCHVGGC